MGEEREITQSWQVGDVRLTSIVESQTDGIPPEFFLVDADDTLWENNVFFEQAIGEERTGDTRWLVAERDGAVIGMVEAAVLRPAPDAHRQIQRDLSRTRLAVNLLVVTEGYRRRGVGTALMEAAEEWGRGGGARRGRGGWRRGRRRCPALRRPRRAGRRRFPAPAGAARPRPARR